MAVAVAILMRCSSTVGDDCHFTDDAGDGNVRLTIRTATSSVGEEWILCSKGTSA
ncbi:hypothetical protein [Microbacterium sp. SLBN-146]|uniref:hypothetical protein n=1 Tax=Microbacterium sp. SLBN-146 TaxID=2768457 RepID=UPI0011675F36|nr:hypothetical protein [Microbacterium sp. SLBN-146]TQJ30958.1 hypothetical protein FBY39_1417 [Microbacterium sp. SLBN-146]